MYAPSVGRVPLPLFDVRLGTSNLAYDSSGHRVGPPGAACTFAAWSPDGKWMYMSSSRSGTFHTWRQRYPGAMAPDGRSFVAAVAQKQSTVWVHDKNGERQVSLEGYSYDPRFAPDGKKLLYRILKGAVPTFDPGELRLLELDSGHNELLLPGLFVSGLPGHSYDISPDGKRVVARAADAQGKPRLWLAALDRQSPPRQIPNVEGLSPRFGENGQIFFNTGEETTHAYRVQEDGTGLRILEDQTTRRAGDRSLWGRSRSDSRRVRLRAVLSAAKSLTYPDPITEKLLELAVVGWPTDPLDTRSHC